MSNNEDEFSSNPGFLKYKVEQVEKLVYPLIDMVNNLDKKVSLLTQKIVIATAVIWIVFQGFGLWYSNSKSETQYSENEKKIYYDMRMQESETIKGLKEEIERLKRTKQ